MAKSKKIITTLLILSSLFTVSARAGLDCSALQASPIFHTVNPKTGTNLLTASEKEAINAVKYGFTDNRGVAFQAALSPNNGLIAVHRLYNAKNGDFFWTPNQNEIASSIAKYGYAYNGVNFFASSSPGTCTLPVYRFLRNGIHRFATSQKDRDDLLATGWVNEGIKFYAGQEKPEEPLPALGINLGAAKDWSSEWFFTDVMKAARPFASVSAPWDGKKNPVQTDANGWPLGDAGVLAMAINEDHSDVKPHVSGTYKLYFDGPAAPNARVKANGKLLPISYDAVTKSYTADVQYNNNGNLFFTFEGIRGGAKNIRLIRPGDNPSETFNPLFLQQAKAGDNMFGILRFMETASTNGSPVAEWGERTSKEYATQQRQLNGRDAGMAWEYIIEIANQTGTDPWINIPHKASEEYIRNLALLFKNNLNSDRKIYLEYSNEIWNEMQSPNFVQRWEISREACDKVNQAGDPDNYFFGLSGNMNDCYTPQANNQGLEYAYLGRHSAWKLKQITDIFTEVFGSSALLTRIRPILAWDIWTLNKTKAGTLTDQLEYLNRMYGTPSKYIYGVACGAYISILSKAGDASSNPHDLALSVNELFERMTENNQTFLPERFALLRRLADQYGLKMFAYEGGPGLFGSKNFDNMLSAHNDPRMKKLVKTLLQNWKDAGGDTFIYYNLVSSYGKHGFWGLSERLEDQETPKWQALKEKAAEWR